VSLDETTCKSCQAPIVFAFSEKGKSMPLNAQPQRLFIVDELGDGSFVARSRLVYTSHFVTCPNADHHRRDR
jgi:hypothetical protein